jgi:signal peptidase I
MKKITPGMNQAIRGDRLGLTDLLEKFGAAGLRCSDLLLPGQTIRLRVASWSMFPALQKGDQITVEHASPAQLQVGDLLVFHHQLPQGALLICHRLVALDDAGAVPRLITKGECCDSCDAAIQPDQVLGRVVAVTPRWPWARTSGWASAQAMRVGLAQERLTLLLAQWLHYLQGLRAYRWIMRSVLSHSFAFYHGVPEGSQWIRYQPISRGGDATLPTGHRDFHFLAKLGETCVGSIQCKAGAEGYRIDDLYVRIRFRGMGVGSQLLALAATAAAVSGVRVLLASVEPANTAALHLLTKMGFCKTGGLHGNEVSLRRDL